MQPQLLDALKGLKGPDAWNQSKLGAVLRHRLLTAANVEDVCAMLTKAGSRLAGDARKQKAALIAERLRSFYSETPEPATAPALLQLDQYLSLGTSGRVIAQARFPFASTDPNSASVIGVWQVVSVGEGSGEVEYSLIGTHPNGPTGVSHPLLDAELSSGFNRALEAAQQAAGAKADQDLAIGLHFEAFQGQCSFPGAEQMGGPSGSLALFIALLCAWHKLPLSTTDDLLFSADILASGEVGPVGYQTEKFRALRDCARFRKFFHCLNAGALDPELERISVPIQGALSNVWSQVQADQQHLRDWVRSQIRQFDEEIGESGRRPSDYDELKIRIVKTEMVPDAVLIEDESQPDKPAETPPADPPSDLPEQLEANLEEGAPQQKASRPGFKPKSTDIVGLRLFEQEVLRSPYGPSSQPPIVVGAPGIGKSFSTRSLVRRLLSRWLDDPTSEVFAVWVNLPSLPKDWVPDKSPAEAIAAALKLAGDQKDQLVHAIKTKRLLLVLDAFDQASAYQQELELENPDNEGEPIRLYRLAAFLNNLLDERTQATDLYPLIMTRPVTQWTLRRQFPTGHAAEVNYQQAEFSLDIVKDFLKIRLEDDVLTERVLSIRQHTGQDLLGVPIILEILSELAVSGQLADEGRWKDDGSVVVRWNTYDRIIKHRLAKAAKSLVSKGLLDSAETGVVEDCFDVLSLLSVHLWDYDPGRNLFTLAEWREKLGSACRTFGFSRTTAEQVLREAGLFDLGVRGNDAGEEVDKAEDGEKAGHSWGNVIHRTILEYMRSAELQTQLQTALEQADDWEKVWSWKRSNGQRFRYSLDLIIDRKAWDEQWAEVFSFWAGWLSDFRSEGGQVLVGFLERVEANDCLIHSRLNLALCCLRQAWFLYDESLSIAPHRELIDWCSCKRNELRALEAKCLVPWCYAAWHSMKLFTATEIDDLLDSKVLWEPASLSRGFVGSLISRLESENFDYFPLSLTRAVESWSFHGDSVLLYRLISRFESEEDADVRCSLASAVGSWSAHGDSVLLDRLISRLESETNRHVRRSLASAVGSWSVHGDVVLLERLIFRLESERDDVVRRSLASAVGSWSVHGDAVLLERLISRLESEQDMFVCSSLAAAVGLWSVHGDEVLLDRLISRLEYEEESYLRDFLAKAIVSWSVHGDSVLLDRLISRLESEGDWIVCDSFAEVVGSWSVHGDTVLLGRLISRIESAADWRVHRFLARAVGSWSVHGDSVLLERLISRIESAGDWRVRGSLASAVGSWSVHGDSVLLDRLIARLESEEDRRVRRSLADAVGSWSAHGNSVLLDRLLSRLISRRDSKGDSSVRSSLASALGSWSVHGDSVLLDRLLSRVATEKEWRVRDSLASAVGALSVHGDADLLKRLILCLESEENWQVRRSLAAAVGALSVHGDVVLLERLISRLESEERDDLVRDFLVEAVRRLQTGPEGPRRFLPANHPYFVHTSRQAQAARGVVLVSELADLDRED